METTADLFVWSDKYSVGVPQIDEQHRKLVSLINDLYRAMRDGKANVILAKLFDALMRYTQQHFAYEEDLMRRHQYAGTAAHILEHQALTRQVHELRDKFAAGKVAITLQVMSFLKDWLHNHILGSDAKYSLALRTNTIAPR